MREKLPSYLLLSVMSFAFFTAIFHTAAAYADESEGIFPSPTQTQMQSGPTPTIYLAPATEPTDIPTFSLTYPTPTPIPTAIPDVPAPEQLEAFFTSAADAYQIDKNLLKKIAKCESNFNPNATNGPYVGMFQFVASTWSANRTRMGLDPNPELRTNAEEAIKTTAFMIAQGNKNAWPNCH